MLDTLHFLPAPPEDSLLYLGSYDPAWIVISILLPTLAAYAALSAEARAALQRDPVSRIIWWSIAVFTLGAGIWAMHFIGMMALELPCRVNYDPMITLVSMFPGVLAGIAALGIVWRNRIKHLSPLPGSLLLGTGIGTMHYTGMAAMQLEGLVRYDPLLFVLSIIVAVVLSYLALKMKNSLACVKQRCNLLVAFILGGAVSGTHYTAMSAAYFVRGDAGALPPSIFTANSLSIIVTLVTAFLALGALALATISRNREVTGRLAESEQRLRTLISATSQMVWHTDARGEVVEDIPTWRAYTGQSAGEVKGWGWITALHPDDAGKTAAVWKEAIATRSPYETEYRVRRHDGGYDHFSVRGVPVLDADGNIREWVGTCTNITEKLQADNDLRIAATAFESQEGLVITDANQKILRVNQAFTETTGYTSEELVGNTPRLLKSGRHDANFYRAMWDSLNSTGSWQGEIWDRRKDGEIFPKWLSITAVKQADGTVTHYVGSHVDITERKAAERKINHLAFYDPLTNLPNRRLFMDRIQHALATSSRSGRRGALLFLDLDNFKTLNDTMGHDVGDHLLQQVAQRLVPCVRDGDTVARLGGDEFVVVLEGLSEDSLDAAAQTESITAKILACLSHPYRLDMNGHRSTASIGAVLFKGQQSSPEQLLKQADIAMYQAKAAGRNTMRFFDPKMQSALKEHSAIERELHQALEKEEFQLYYQLQVDDSNRPSGAEVLIRWIHPERGFVSPAQFIPLAEESGMILGIGAWVLDTACARLKIWQQDKHASNLVLSVNVSAKQFRQADFVEQVKAAVQRHDIDPRLLKLELTEGMLVENLEDIIAKMNTLKALGIRFSLDDFGTGYSSLQYLNKLPLAQLKIDQSFVRNMSAEGENAIVRTIISMGHSLNMEVIAEGVETEAQRQLLFSYGCRHYQGYLFSKPVPVAQFEALLSI